MPDTARARWYRHGGVRLLVSIVIALLGLVPASLLIVDGIGPPVRWMFIVPGAVLVAAIEVWAWVPMRAGIGVTAEHVLIRTVIGSTRTVPWDKVIRFEGGKSSPDSGSDDTIFVLTSDRKRWRTAGCSAAFASRAEVWPLVRALEDERLARVPGAVSSLPSSLSSPEPGEFAAGLYFAVIGVSVLLAFGTIGLFAGIQGSGPGLRAAYGRGAVGYYVPQRETAGTRWSASTWYGEFRLPDGTVTRRDVIIHDVSAGALRAGVPVAARDVGGSYGIFPREDPGAWQGAVIGFLVAAGLYAAALVVIIRMVIRLVRHGRRHANLIGSST